MNEMLEQLGICDQVKQMEGVVVDSDGKVVKLPSIPKGITVLSPKQEELKKNYIYVYPKTFDQLRNLIGVPEETANANVSTYKTAFEKKEEAGKEQLAYELLKAPTQVYQTLFNDTQLEEMKQWILQNAEVIPVLCAEELDIEKNGFYQIKETPLAVFDNITIESDGQMAPDSQSKVVICGKLKHVN